MVIYGSIVSYRDWVSGNNREWHDVQLISGSGRAAVRVPPPILPFMEYYLFSLPASEKKARVPLVEN